MKQYAKAHVLSRFTAYQPTEAIWHLDAWTRQLKRTAPVTRHYAAVVVDTAGNTLKRIEMTALTYTALRRIGHEIPTQAALSHTPGVVYDDPAQVLDVNRRAHVVLQEANRLQDHLQAAIALVKETPGIMLGLADAYLFEAEPALRTLAVVHILETQIQQLGPPSFQLGITEVLESLERAEAIIAEVTRFTREVTTPLPVITSFQQMSRLKSRVGMLKRSMPRRSCAYQLVCDTPCPSSETMSWHLNPSMPLIYGCWKASGNW